MNKIFMVLFSVAFLFGQFGRIEFGNGISLIGLDIVAGVFSVYWLVKTIILKKHISSPLTLPVIIFSAVAIQALLVNLSWLRLDQGLIAGLYLVRFLSYAGIYFYVREFLESDRKWFMKAILVLITGTVTIGLLQYFYYPSLRNLYYLGWDDHLYRLFSVFHDPNFTGALFVCFLMYLATYYYSFKKYAVIQQAGLVALSVVTVASVFLTYSRTALLMLIGGGIVYLMLVGKRLFVLVFLLCVGIALLLTVDTGIEGLNPFRIVSTQARINSLQIATDIFVKHPVLGVGFNAYRYAQNEYGYRSDDMWQTSHADSGTDNSFFLVLATTGIVGFSVYLFLWFRILKDIIEKVKEGNYFAKVTLAMVIALFIGSFFLNVLFYPFILVWLFSIIALTESTSR